MYCSSWPTEDLLPSPIAEGRMEADHNDGIQVHAEGGRCTVTMEKKWCQCVEDCTGVSLKILCLWMCECVCSMCLYQWVPGNNWRNKYQTALHVLLMNVVQLGFWVPTPSPWAWYCHTWRVLAFLQMDLPALALSAWVLPKHPSASLGRCDRLAAAKDFAFTYFACVHVHDYAFYKTILELALLGSTVYRCSATFT